MLLKDELTLNNARKIALADLAFGISAGVIFVVGFLRVFYFEKGAAYYFGNVAFLAKLSLIVVVALLFLYPTVEFLSWRKSLQQNQIPVVDSRRLRSIHSVIHVELAGIVLLILCAALMARGAGSFS